MTDETTEDKEEAEPRNRVIQIGRTSIINELATIGNERGRDLALGSYNQVRMASELDPAILWANTGIPKSGISHGNKTSLARIVPKPLALMLALLGVSLVPIFCYRQ
jgi:hypothetical protein